MENTPIKRKELEEKLTYQLNIREALHHLREAITHVCAIENRFQRDFEMRSRARDIHKALGAFFRDVMEKDTMQSIIIGKEEVFIYPTSPIIDEREGDDIDL